MDKRRGGGGQSGKIREKENGSIFIYKQQLIIRSLLKYSSTVSFLSSFILWAGSSQF